MRLMMYWTGVPRASVSMQADPIISSNTPNIDIMMLLNIISTKDVKSDSSLPRQEAYCWS